MKFLTCEFCRTNTSVLQRWKSFTSSTIQTWPTITDVSLPTILYIVCLHSWTNQIYLFGINNYLLKWKQNNKVKICNKISWNTWTLFSLRNLYFFFYYFDSNIFSPYMVKFKFKFNRKISTWTSGPWSHNNS